MQARLLCTLALTSSLALAVRGGDVRLFAAASLADALRELAPVYESESGHRLMLNLGASGLLVRQIQEGAAADVFFSADELRVAQLEKEGLALAETRRVLLSNQLVLIVPAEDVSAIRGFDDLRQKRVRRLAIGEPATVPAGTYAKAYLERIQLWDVVRTKIVPLDNVRAVLAAVAAGNAEAGIVYRTDARTEKRVQMAAIVARDEGPAIVYPAVVLKGAADADAARGLLAFLSSARAQAVFAEHGFLRVVH